MGQNVERSASQLTDDVRGVVLEEAGHWLTDERPEELSATLLEFFTQQAEG
jgi:pimeloyl-ACP methyl ester carboxylesterase